MNAMYSQSWRVPTELYLCGVLSLEMSDNFTSILLRTAFDDTKGKVPRKELYRAADGRLYASRLLP